MSDESVVAAVILNYRNPEDTIASARSITSSTYAKCYVIVVDNGSADGSVRRIQEALPEVQLLVSEQNLGFSAGVNLGIEHALHLGAGYVWLLNNDAVADPKCLERLVRVTAKDSTVGVAVPKIYYADDPTRIWSAGARWEGFPPRVKMIGLGERDSRKYDRQQDVDYATGCAMLIPRHIFESIGFFDPVYFMYQEDYDFCHRVRKAGFRILYVPRSHVWHKVSQSLGEGSPDKWYLWSRSAVVFYRKYFSLPALLCFLGWVVARELARGSLSALPPLVRGARDGVRIGAP